MKKYIRKDVLLNFLISIVLTSYFHVPLKTTFKYIYREAPVTILSDIGGFLYDYSLSSTFILVSIIIFNIQGLAIKKD